MALIKKIMSKKYTIKEASEELGIKFSTSKVILQTFRREGRIGKKKTRMRKKNNEITST
jgi:transcription initiation factor IIE alpha subunit